MQYLHQLGLLRVLPHLIGHIIVPPAVVDELAVGRSLGVNLPDVSGYVSCAPAHPYLPSEPGSCEAATSVRTRKPSPNRLICRGKTQTLICGYKFKNKGGSRKIQHMIFPNR